MYDSQLLHRRESLTRGVLSWRCAQGMLRDIERKRQELLNTTTQHAAREGVLLAEMRALKTTVERELSASFKGRPVHIVGAVNTLLRAS
jgi:hypothetical protein